MAEKPVAAGKSSFDLIDSAAFFTGIEIKPGDKVLDLACGAGRYSLELSRLSGENGVVYGIDLWDEGIEFLKNEIRTRGITNITPLRADITKGIPLEGESIDLTLMATVLHDLSPEEQDATLKEILRILKPGGIFCLVEFRKIDKGPGPPMRIRISEGEAVEKIEGYGFRKYGLAGIGEYNYMINFKKIG